MNDVERFITGFRTFQQDYYGQDGSLFESLKQGQNPKTMIIGCSDSRVDPALLTKCKPGDIFVVRNVANLVPAFERDGGRQGVSAALEFAVCFLKIKHIIVLGHSRCGGIKALMTGNCDSDEARFISRWMSIAAPVRRQVMKEFPGMDAEYQQRAAEKAAILLSLENLRSYPFVTERVNDATLSLHGWYFDLNSGVLYEYDDEHRAFVCQP